MNHPAAARLPALIAAGAAIVPFGLGERPILPLLPPGGLLLRDGPLLQLRPGGATAHPLAAWSARIAPELGFTAPPVLIDALALADAPPAWLDKTAVVIDAPYVSAFAAFHRLSGTPLAAAGPAGLTDPAWRQRFLLALALARAAGQDAGTAAHSAARLVTAAGGPPDLYDSLIRPAAPGPDLLARLFEDLGATMGGLPAGSLWRIAVHRRVEAAIGAPRDATGWPVELRSALWRALLAAPAAALRLAARRAGHLPPAAPDPAAWSAALPPLIAELALIQPMLPGTLGPGDPRLARALAALRRRQIEPLLADPIRLEWLCGHWPALADGLTALAADPLPPGLRARLSRVLAAANGRNLAEDHL